MNDKYIMTKIDKMAFVRILPKASLVCSLCCLFLGMANADARVLKGNGWEATIDDNSGVIKEFVGDVGGNREVVPFRADTMGGPSFEGVRLHAEGQRFVGRKGNVELSLSYRPLGDHLQVVLSAHNAGSVPYEPVRLRMRVGVDAEMHTFPDWDKKFFPTLMRCEKNFAWGYLMSPRGVIFALGSYSPVASYALNYIEEEKKEWGWGHQIKTESFDLLHRLPLPERHPQHLTRLKPGETRYWYFHLGMASTMDSIKPKLARWLLVPMIELKRYTLTAGENLSFKVFSTKGMRSAVLVRPDGKKHSISFKHFKKVASSVYQCDFNTPDVPGVYKLQILSQNKKKAEASFYVRKAWNWYLNAARDWVVKYPPMAGGSAEQIYGYYAGALGVWHMPKPDSDGKLEQIFERRVCMVIDTSRGVPLSARVLPHRIQNFSTLAGILVDYWRSTGKSKYLRWASRVGDFLCSDSVQWKDGSYRSKGVHYTAVIYPAKSMMELAMAEKEAAATDTCWLAPYRRHLQSAMRAADDLARRLDDIETEGDMTFEDGMISCSALQMGMAGLLSADEGERMRMAMAARYMMQKHRCLEQNLIPDCRMRGATLRFWEALDVYFSPNQVMNSPHGWTSWKIYAYYYLYLLTGETHYLSNMMDTMGACMQVVRDDGKIRWGFLPDPYLESWVCVPDKKEPQGWGRCDSIVGEQYLDLISNWLRPANQDQICDFGQSGGSGDNTVFEMFKALEECVMTTAYVVVPSSGDVEAWNCRARLSDGELVVDNMETSVAKVHVNARRPVRVTLKAAGATKTYPVGVEMKMLYKD